MCNIDFSSQHLISPEIPQYFINALQRLISTRTLLKTYFAESNGYPGESPGPRKSTLTDALLAVRKILTLVREFPDLDVDGFIGESLNNYKIILAFDLDPESMKRPMSAAAGSMEQPEYEAEWERSDEDAFLVHTILLRELHEIRAEVRSLWKKFARGYLSLTCVTMATNVAIQLAELMESEMMAALPTFRFTSSHHLAYEKARIAAEMALPFNKNASREHKLEILYRIKDYCLMQTVHAWALWQKHYRHSSDTVSIYLGKEGRFSPSNPPTGPINMMKEDCAALLEIFGGIAFLLSTDDWATEELDELTSTFIQLWQFSDKVHPLSASLAGSIYLDIIKLLRELGMLQKPADCLALFRRTLLESVLSAEIFASFHLSRKRLMYRIMHGIEIIKDYSRLWDKKNPFREALGKKGISGDVLTERHPLLVGTWIHRTRLGLCDVGSNCAADTGALGFVARLYLSLCRDELLAPGTWLDLEVAIALRSSGAFLGLDPEQTDWASSLDVSNQDSEISRVLVSLRERRAIRSAKVSSLVKTCKYVHEEFETVYTVSFAVTKAKNAIFEREGVRVTGKNEEAKNDKDHQDFLERKSSQQKVATERSSQSSKSEKNSEKRGTQSGQGQESVQIVTKNQAEHGPKATAMAQSHDPKKLTQIGYLSRLFTPDSVFGTSGPHGLVPDELVWAITRRGRYAMNLIDVDNGATETGQETDRSEGVSKASNFKEVVAMDVPLDPCTVSFLCTHLAYGLHDELPETSFDYFAVDLAALEVVRAIANRQKVQHRTRSVGKLAEALGLERLAREGPSLEVLSAFLGKRNVENRKQGVDEAEGDSGPPEPSTDLDLRKLAAEEILKWASKEPRPCCIASTRLCELGTVICMEHCCSSGCAAKMNRPKAPVVQKQGEERSRTSEKEKHSNGKGKGKEKV
ncbi:hypothetical protein PpBr36_06895 [Pyricularia pennisetigena]|uniref:hypothetical protein n=1 Tax=Pyricularia pennisetigena TaxID=1578925 RepID=UPI00114DE317|nr:hypothetical protein PpBr36_06895 [Pyricularia pennisetigena]TLS25547.1 hypothetical protein PpBr36_06895 [Pyricularia pennisetigena]